MKCESLLRCFNKSSEPVESDNQIDKSAAWLDEPVSEPEVPTNSPEAEEAITEPPTEEPVEHQNPSETPTNTEVITQDYVDDNERRRQEVVAMTIQAFEEDEEDDY